jgi:uncharacterized protein involved in high-affinity Fe2+ transport
MKEVLILMRKLLAIAGLFVFVLGVSATAFAADAPFKETPAGEEKEINHMKIAAVYLQPIEMEPQGIDLPASQASCHMECDIHALQGNPNGFGAGEWIPYLTISYTLTNKDTGKTMNGTFMPMIAKDGPHYGANLPKTVTAGNYKMTYNIEPPQRNGFGRHTDKTTGVGKWFKPFSVDFEFKFVPPPPSKD